MEDARFRKVEFEGFRQLMLLRRLDEIPIRELHAAIMRESDRAASLAKATSYPFLIFPCLFDERVTAAAERFQEQQHNYWQTLGAVP